MAENSTLSTSIWTVGRKFGGAAKWQRKVSDSQVAGIKAHAEAKNKETIDKVNKAIDKLKKEEQNLFNFETVCKEAGVSKSNSFTTMHSLRNVF